MGAGDAIIQLDNSGGESSESDGEGTEVKQYDIIYYTADNHWCGQCLRVKAEMYYKLSLAQLSGSKKKKFSGDFLQCAYAYWVYPYYTRPKPLKLWYL